MGETEGKKDEADYKRLQTFPLVRVRPWRLGRQGGQAPIVSLCSGPRSVLQTSEQGLTSGAQLGSGYPACAFNSVPSIPPQHSDMPEEMRVETMELCVMACEKFSNNNEVSQASPSWKGGSGAPPFSSSSVYGQPGWGTLSRQRTGLLGVVRGP